MDKDELQRRAIAMRELTRTEGWKILMEEMNVEELQLLNDLKDITIEGRSVHDIGTEYVEISSRITGLKRANEIAESVIGAFVDEE